MIAKILELVTGKDDLERVAYRESLDELTAYLKRRRLLIPRKPKRFLDASAYTHQQLIELIEKETKDLAGDQFEPWVMEMDGKKRLPAFSSQKKMETFSSKVSQRLNKVFSLGCAAFLFDDIIKRVDVDFVDLNPFSKKSWEIGVGKCNTQGTKF